jgi:hypothetical protein
MPKLRNRLTVIVGVVALLAAPAVAGAIGGFQGPLFGLTTAPNGDILIADAAVGIDSISARNGQVGPTIARPGATDVDAIGRSSLWVTTGAGGDPTTNTGQGLWRVSNDEADLIADLFGFESSENPDGHIPGHEVADSNPFDVQALRGRAAVVADAGGNDLLEVDNDGDIDVLAVFPDELVSTQNIKNLAGCPQAPEEFAFACGLPEAIPAEAVPTSIAVGPNGHFYVGELKGFPAPTGESRIWKVAPDATGADCPNPNCLIAFDGGFTSIIDLAFGPDGNLYVAELDEQSWAAVEIFQTGAGGSINSCNVSTLSCTEVATGIPMLTSITFGKDGTLWATRNALVPGQAEVIEIP